jgi:hypothetical protein
MKRLLVMASFAAAGWPRDASRAVTPSVRVGTTLYRDRRLPSSPSSLDRIRLLKLRKWNDGFSSRFSSAFW